jgi:hypothetical protein
MSDTREKRFNSRAFVVLVVAAAGIGLPISGLGNHVLQLDSLTGNRHAWMSAHNGLAVLFLTFVVWHLILNRNAFLHHVRGAAADWRPISREALWATTLVAVVLAVAVGHALHAH